MVMIAQMKDKQQFKQKIHEAVCHMYETVSLNPGQGFHFPVGRLAAEQVGYPSELLADIPETAVESFAGVGYHFSNDAIKPGDAVLDVGSGSGTDLLVAAQLAGPKGRVVGVDITDAMIDKARKAIKQAGADNVEIIKTTDDKLPFPDNSFDVVISNGVINLIFNKKGAFDEIYRVLKPGGTLSFADIVLGEPISEQSRQNPALWSECVVGASVVDEFTKMIENAGFSDVAVTQELDYFANSSSENTKAVAKRFKAHSVVIKATKQED